MFGVHVGTEMGFTDEDLLAAIDGLCEDFMHGLNVPLEIVQAIGCVRTLRTRESTANLQVRQGGRGRTGFLMRSLGSVTEAGRLFGCGYGSRSIQDW